MSTDNVRAALRNVFGVEDGEPDGPTSQDAETGTKPTARINPPTTVTIVGTREDVNDVAHRLLTLRTFTIDSVTDDDRGVRTIIIEYQRRDVNVQ